MYTKDRLKILIDLLGLKLKDFSRKTGIPYQSLLKYLSGERTPTEENLQKMAIHLGVNLNWLLTGEGEPLIKKEKEWEGMVCESPSPYIDDVTQKILIILKDMDQETRREILKHIEEKKLLRELLKKQKLKKEAS